MVDSTTRVLDLESAANRFYQTTYKLTSSGRLFLTIVETDSALNTTTISKQYDISAIAKEQTLAVSSSNGQWYISAPKRTFQEDGYLMVSEMNNETAILHGQTVMTMAKVLNRWRSMNAGLHIQGSAPIAAGEGLMVTLKYDDNALTAIQAQYTDFDERKIGLYAECNGEWIYIGREEKNGQEQAKEKQYGIIKLMHNPEYAFLLTKLELAMNYPNLFNL